MGLGNIMLYSMNLQNNSFQSIKNGTKTIEMRLNDEKRKLIKVNDEIEFINAETKETIRCQVICIYRYANFYGLYSNHDKVSLGYNENETAHPKDMFTYYSEDKIKKYGVLGIKLKLI